MPLSIVKLNEFFESSGFIPFKYYTFDDFCIFTELVSSKTAARFMIYIPEKYRIPINEKGENIFELELVKFGEKDDYVQDPSELDIEEQYDMDMTRNPSSPNLRQRMLDKYKRNLDLNSGEDLSMAKDMVRQLSRLKYSVQDLKYKLLIKEKSCMAILSKDNTINCFKVKDITDCRTLYVILPLDVFYQKYATVEEDIRKINQGIFKILEKNQNYHLRNLQLLTEIRYGLVHHCDKLKKKMTGYMKNLDRSEGMLTTLTLAEKKLLQELQEISYSGSSFHTDAVISHRKGVIERKLSDIGETKDELIQIIFSINDQIQTFNLSVDKILFDNLVMMDTIFDNLETLGKLVG